MAVDGREIDLRLLRGPRALLPAQDAGGGSPESHHALLHRLYINSLLEQMEKKIHKT